MASIAERPCEQDSVADLAHAGFVFQRDLTYALEDSQPLSAERLHARHEIQPSTSTTDVESLPYLGFGEDFNQFARLEIESGWAGAGRCICMRVRALRLWPCRLQEPMFAQLRENLAARFCQPICLQVPVKALQIEGEPSYWS